MSDTLNTQTTPARTNNWKSVGLRLLIAIPLAVFAVWLAITLYDPFSLIAGMILDSCSGGYTLWEIWLRVLWPGILIVSALAPPLLIVLKRRWRWVLLSMVLGTGFSVTWYVLWFVIAMMACGK